MKRRRSYLKWLAAAILIVAVYKLHQSGYASEIPSIESGTAGIANAPVYKVVIDPGHGGTDQGAAGASGENEKDFTLQLSHKVKELIQEEPRIEVYMTRTDDRFLSSVDRERPEMANQLDADLFISIHGNTYTDPDVSGTETYYYRKESFKLAKILHKHVAEATGFRDRGVKKEDFFVIKDTKMPAVLLEVGYLTNPRDEAQMFTDDFQYRIAASIREGMKEYLKIS